MNDAKEFLCTARPHPGPLPRGEGESFAATQNVVSLCLLKVHWPNLSRPIAIPSPGGEGQDEGGRFIKLLSRLDVSHA